MKKSPHSDPRAIAPETLDDFGPTSKILLKNDFELFSHAMPTSYIHASSSNKLTTLTILIKLMFGQFVGLSPNPVC